MGLAPAMRKADPVTASDGHHGPGDDDAGAPQATLDRAACLELMPPPGRARP